MEPIVDQYAVMFDKNDNENILMIHMSWYSKLKTILFIVSEYILLVFNA